MNLRGIGWEGVDWMHLTQDRDQWRALVNIYLQGILLPAEWLLASQEVLCSMELLVS